MGSLTVLECYDEYLPRTQTFIYFQLKALRGVRPVVASYHPFSNLALFPLDGIPHYSVAPRAYSVQQVWQRAVRGVRGRGWLESYRWDRFASQMEPYGIAVLHAHFGPTGYMTLPLKRRLSVPMITTFYGRDATAADDGWSRKPLHSECDLFLVEGPFLAQQLQKRGCPAGKICIHPIAIPVAQYAFRESRPAKRPVLLSAARFIEKKGLIYGLEAARILLDRGWQFEFRVIGSGPLEQELRDFARDHGLERCVKFLGFLDHPQYLAELRDADIFVQPSVTARDEDTEGGAPTTLLEAQAFGLPIAATRHADIPNVVAPGESALLSPERDAEALANDLESLISSPERWPSMARAGRKFVEQHHDVQSQTEKLEQIYSALAQGRRPVDSALQGSLIVEGDPGPR